MGIDCYFFSKVKVKENGNIDWDECEEVDMYEVKELEYLGFNHPNITHNLCEMAENLKVDGLPNCYEAIWHPETITQAQGRDSLEFTAGELLKILAPSYAKLVQEPDYFKQFNSPNGWGTYDNFCLFVNGLIGVCRRYPDAIYYASR